MAENTRARSAERAQISAAGAGAATAQISAAGASAATAQISDAGASAATATTASRERATVELTLQFNFFVEELRVADEVQGDPRVDT